MGRRGMNDFERREEWKSGGVGGVECWLDRVKIGFGVEAKYSFAVI